MSMQVNWIYFQWFNFGIEAKLNKKLWRVKIKTIDEVSATTNACIWNKKGLKILQHKWTWWNKVRCSDANYLIEIEKILIAIHLKIVLLSFIHTSLILIKNNFVKMLVAQAKLIYHSIVTWLALHQLHRVPVTLPLATVVSSSCFGWDWHWPIVSRRVSSSCPWRLLKTLRRCFRSALRMRGNEERRHFWRSSGVALDHILVFGR